MSYNSDLQKNNTALTGILNTINELPNADSVPSEAVLYVPQTLTDGQKEQARENIGVGEEYRAELNAYIAEELAKRGQWEPEFINSFSELEANGDQTKLYVLPDGYIYAFMYAEVEAEPAYSNVIAIHECEIGKRLSSSGATKDLEGYFVTGYISVTSADQGKLLRYRGASLNIANGSFCFYNSSKNIVGAIAYNGGTGEGTDENGDTYITLGTGGNSAGDITYDMTDVAYIRLCFAIPSEGAASVIVTIDEPIVENEEVTKKYQWANTGHHITPADYEDRIIALEKWVFSGATLVGTVDDDNIITVTGALAPGVYTLKYELPDGTKETIGTVIV